MRKSGEKQMKSNLKDLWRKLTAPRATYENEAQREYIADVIAERERLLAAERAQARRQAALLRLSAELAATLEEHEICRRVVDGLHDTLGYDVQALYLVDETTGDRVHVASVGFVEPPPRIPPGQGLSERPLLDGQLHYTPDVTQDPRYFYGLQGSEVDVPVRIGGQVLGVLIAERKERHAFSQDEFEVLTAATQQAGLAIEKARLLAAERQRADELDALRTTMAEVTAELELSTLLQAIVERATGLLDATMGELGLYDEASQKVRVAFAYGLDQDTVGLRHPLGEGAMGCVAETGEPLIIQDYHAWERRRRVPQYADLALHSVVAAPLKVGGRLVGVINLGDANPARQFNPAELHLLNLFAQQAAIAIENARLFGETERRVAELATLTEVGQALSSTLRVDEVLELIYGQTRRVMYAEDMVIALYDPARHEIECAFSTNPDDVTVGARFPADAGVTGHVIKHRKSLLVRDNVVERIRELGIELIGQPSASGLAVPMLRGERVLGVIILQHYTTPNVYNESHQVLLETVASQAAIAIDNAWLYDQAQREIVERVRAEEELRRYQEHLEERVEERTVELRQSEERYRTLFDGVPVGLYRTTPAGQIVDANLALVEMLGYPSRADYLQVDSATVYVNPQDRVRWQALMEREGVVRDFEARLRRHDGTVIWANDTARAVKDEQGQVLHYEGSLENITERKQAEAELRKYQEHLEELVEARTTELRESEERYRTLFDGVPVGLYRSTPAGQIVDANLALAHMLGYASQEDVLAFDPASFYVDLEERVRWQALMEREGVVRDFQYQLRRYDGTVIWVNNTARAVRDEQGQVLYYEGSVEDITQRKQAEAELRRYQEHLEELVEERTAELRQSEERYRTLFDGVPVGLYRTTPAGQIVDANLALVHMLGYAKREDVLAIDPASFYVDPEERVRWQALMEREGVVRDFQYQLRRYDGTVIWVNNTARAVRDEQGQVVYYEGSLEDITQRKQAEAELCRYQEHLEELVEERTAELQESEERYRTLFDGVPVGLYRTTPNGQFLDVNRAFVEMSGYPDREALLATQTASFYVDPEEQVRWRALIEREGVVRDFEAWLRRADGSVRWANESARAVKDEQGRVLYYEGSVEDITERKQFEEELRRQKEYYEALFVNSPVAVVTVDLDGNVLSWNPTAEKLFGYTQAEALGRNVDDLVATDDSIRAEAVAYTELFLTDPVAHADFSRAEAFTNLGLVDDLGRGRVTTKRTRKDGTLVDVELLGLPVSVAGEYVGIIAIYNDITDLQEARRHAEAANQAKSAFLANMSHELRTPLNAILGFTQLMDSDPNLTAEQQQNLGIINRSGEHLLALINDVLEMSKIEAGRVTLQEKSFDLYHLLDGLEEMFRLRAKDKGLALTFERAETVPRYVRTDEGKLRQVLSNLLGNAVKFTQVGGVVLRVGAKGKRRRTKEQPSPIVRRSSLVFEVQDTGPGIPPEELDAVFDPFVQATSGRDLAATQSQAGTGLGLSISRQYVRLMGGDITVSSELGQGSLFKFGVQVGLADAAEVQAAQPRRRVLGLEPNQRAADGGPYRLLVAEDQETNRQLLVKLLEPLDFEVKEAVNGQEAIEIWEHWQPHLIWMDMRMPVIDGYKATRYIKSEIQNRKLGLSEAEGSEIQTVIIALTATAFEEDRERVLLEGCDDFVRKPFRKDEIFDMLAKHLGVRFVYEEIERGDREKRQDTSETLRRGLSPADVAALPAGWVADLRGATIKADLNLMLTLIDQIRGDNPALADALVDLANNFEYQKILTLIEQAGG
jgi:PAS domain S-box-containing protein